MQKFSTCRVSWKKYFPPPNTATVSEAHLQFSNPPIGSPPYSVAHERGDGVAGNDLAPIHPIQYSPHHPSIQETPPRRERSCREKEDDPTNLDRGPTPLPRRHRRTQLDREWEKGASAIRSLNEKVKTRSVCLCRLLPYGSIFVAAEGRVLLHIDFVPNS